MMLVVEGGEERPRREREAREEDDRRIEQVKRIRI
jgi:hypothetical protein